MSLNMRLAAPLFCFIFIVVDALYLTESLTVTKKPRASDPWTSLLEIPSQNRWGDSTGNRPVFHMSPVTVVDFAPLAAESSLRRPISVKSLSSSGGARTEKKWAVSQRADLNAQARQLEDAMAIFAGGPIRSRATHATVI